MVLLRDAVIPPFLSLIEQNFYFIGSFFIGIKPGSVFIAILISIYLLFIILRFAEVFLPCLLPFFPKGVQIG